MNRRTRRAAITFGLCAATVLTAMAGLTQHVLHGQRAEHAAQVQASFQEASRLVLWRMETRLAPLLATEAARPYFHYRAFYARDRAYDQMFVRLAPGEVLTPSPLLTSETEFVLLYFQIEPDGTLSSPQAPIGDSRELAEDLALSRYTDPLRIIRAEQKLSHLSRILPADRRWALHALKDAEQVDAQTGEESLLLSQADENIRNKQQSVNELRARQSIAKITRGGKGRTFQDQTQSTSVDNPKRLASTPNTKLSEDPKKLTDATAPEQMQEFADAEAGGDAESLFRADKDEIMLDEPDASVRDDGSFPIVHQGPLEVRWIHATDNQDELMLIRVVSQGQAQTVQGIWIDWPGLKAELLSLADGVLSDADLIPIELPEADPSVNADPMLLASIPARLMAKPIAQQAALAPLGFSSPVIRTLVIAWAGVLVGVAAIGIVLWTAIELGERRGRFVAAVTHELRTPLTTFCLYSDMLAGDLIQEPEKKRTYIQTLQKESRRLAEIVENVLEYARLGDRAGIKGCQAIELGPLVQDLAQRLTIRAESGSMELTVEIEVDGGCRVFAQPRAVERIMVNLVDNAIKYAGGAKNNNLIFRVSLRGDGIFFCLQDFGAGISRSDRLRIFEPFNRGKGRENDPKPGIGLGLSISKELAHQMGGSLTLARDTSQGCCFCLKLRVGPVYSK